MFESQSFLTRRDILMSTAMRNSNQIYKDILEHHGVLGMKWGVRRYQPYPDGSKKGKFLGKSPKNKTKQELTLEAKQKQAKLEYKKARNQYNKESLLYSAPSAEAINRVKQTKRTYKHTKENLKVYQTHQKLSLNKSKTQLKLEEKYKNKGYSSQAAELAAYQNIRTRKMLAGVMGAALVAGAAYGVYKYRDENVDKIIKSDKSLGRIASSDTEGVRDAFYVYTNKYDGMRYKGLYSQAVQKRDGEAYLKNIKTLSDIKQASPKTARETLQDLISKDPEYKNHVKESLTKWATGGLGDKQTVSRRALASKALHELENTGKISKSGYEAYNLMLVDKTLDSKRFYKALSGKGYNAIKDICDSKLSGYNALNPLILFDTSNKVKVTDVRKLAANEVNLNMAGVLGEMTVRQAAKPITAISAAMIAMDKLADISARGGTKNKVINTYRQNHPKTKLTDVEILQKIERQRGG